MDADGRLLVPYWLRAVRIGLEVTVAAYLAAIGVPGWHASPASLVMGISILGTLTLLTSFMFRELVTQMRAQDEARGSSERWADLLSAVAAATREMALQQDEI